MCLGTTFEIYLIYINYWVVETPISYGCKANDVNSSPSYLENLLIEKRLSPEEGRAFLLVGEKVCIFSPIIISFRRTFIGEYLNKILIL